MTEAENQALAQMSRRISVSIFNFSSESDASGIAAQKSILQSVSSARFTNVQIRVLSEEPNASVFCFISRDEVKKMFQQREQRIQDLIETGKIAESRLQIDDALRCYYWALVLANTNPEPTRISFGDKEGLASSLLPLKIKSIFQLLQVKAIESDNSESGIKGSLFLLTTVKLCHLYNSNTMMVKA